MQEVVERAALVRVREHELAQRGPIELAARGHDLGTERGADRLEHGLPRRDDLARDQVCVDELGAELHKHARDERFAARDSAREPDPQGARARRGAVVGHARNNRP